RDLTGPVLQEMRAVTSRPNAVAVVIVPELVVKKWWHTFLHNQRPLFLKRLLLFEPGVILTSVPYQLQSAQARGHRAGPNARSGGDRQGHHVPPPGQRGGRDAPPWPS